MHRVGGPLAPKLEFPHPACRVFCPFSQFLPPIPTPRCFLSPVFTTRPLLLNHSSSQNTQLYIIRKLILYVTCGAPTIPPKQIIHEEIVGGSRLEPLHALQYIGGHYILHIDHRSDLSDSGPYPVDLGFIPLQPPGRGKGAGAPPPKRYK
jgi:hypothetical protein